jgi:hypothetical protein
VRGAVVFSDGGWSAPANFGLGSAQLAGGPAGFVVAQLQPADGGAPVGRVYSGGSWTTTTLPFTGTTALYCAADINGFSVFSDGPTDQLVQYRSAGWQSAVSVDATTGMAIRAFASTSDGTLGVAYTDGGSLTLASVATTGALTPLYSVDGGSTVVLGAGGSTFHLTYLKPDEVLPRNDVWDYRTP